MYVLLYALCRGRGLYDVTVTCRTSIMMLVVYCLFLVVLYVCIFVCGSAIRWLPVDGWVQRAGDWWKFWDDSEELRNSRLCETQWQTMGKSTVRNVNDMWQITTRHHNYVWDKYSVLRFRLRTINHRKKNHDISMLFDRRCTICTEFILCCLIVCTICPYVRMKNSVLTYFEKAVTKHKERCWNMYGTMTYVYMMCIYVKLRI